MIFLLKSETPVLYVVNDGTINESQNGNYLELSSTCYSWIYPLGWKKISLHTPVQNASRPCRMGTGTFSPGLKRKWPSPHLVKTLRMNTAIHILPPLCLHNMLRGDICFTFIFAFIFTLNFTFTFTYTFTFTPDIACRNCNKLNQRKDIRILA